MAPALADEPNLRSLAVRAASDALRHMHAHLDDARFEDLVSELVVVALRAEPRFDPSFGQARSTFLYRRMRPRVVDYLRAELGDNRQKDGGRGAWRRDLLALDLLDPDNVPSASGEWRDDEAYEAEWDEAIEQLGEGLSEETLETLELVGPLLVDGLRHHEIAAELGWTPGAVQVRLKRLRAELRL